MGELAQKEAVASLLLEHVKNEDVVKIERSFSQFNQDSQWREIVRYEFPVEKLIQDILRYDVVIPRLGAYEITSMSPFHYAAFKGLNEILVAFVEHDVPVDVTLNAGTTVLHLAAFTGKTDTVRLLIEAYRADFNKQDSYGWTALHYASTEGHLEVVEVLLKAGCDVNLRDKDGTSAAFRAQVNGFLEIATLLCSCDDGDGDLLCVDPETDLTSGLTDADLYSRVGKARTLPANQQPPPPNPPAVLRNKTGMSLQNRQVQSEIVTSSSGRVGAGIPQKTQSLPREDREQRKSSIRRVIRKELTAALASEGYMDPQDLTDGDQDAYIGLGVNTLRGIMKEEIGKVTREMFSRSGSTDSGLSTVVPPHSHPKPHSNVDYEDIYETVKALEQANIEAPSKELEAPHKELEDIPEEAPPLPPRNPDMASQGIRIAGQAHPDITHQRSQSLRPVRNQTPDMGSPGIRFMGNQTPDIMPLSMTLDKGSSGSLLRESIKRLAPILGHNWKRLAYALPIHADQEKVLELVDMIVSRRPGDVEGQATMALVQWRTSRGKEADVDDLILALRACGLHTLIEEVERVTQEFTA